MKSNYVCGTDSRVIKLDRDRFLMVLEYVLMSKKVDEKELEEILKESGVKTMPSLAQKWLEQGIQQGMLQDAQEMVIGVSAVRAKNLDDFKADLERALE